MIFCSFLGKIKPRDFRYIIRRSFGIVFKINSWLTHRLAFLKKTRIIYHLMEETEPITSCITPDPDVAYEVLFHRVFIKDEEDPTQIQAWIKCLVPVVTKSQKEHPFIKGIMMHFSMKAYTLQSKYITPHSYRVFSALDGDDGMWLDDVDGFGLGVHPSCNLECIDILSNTPTIINFQSDTGKRSEQIPVTKANEEGDSDTLKKLRAHRYVVIKPEEKEDTNVDNPDNLDKM